MNFPHDVDSDSLVLIRLKAEAILYASRGAEVISYINSSTFDYDFEHLPTKTQTNSLVS
ncbi:hypothetical protein [Actinomyces bowdenii]|uniref:hypothetical protein n=1 Tax=Actinomyces bowdenii TaxID=131109 RepID=UPI001639BBAD|nr:hypothetical protein [Actinomyces bowdenii]